MWRPKNWESYKRTVYNAHNTEAEIFEAGANAMQKALIDWIKTHARTEYCPRVGELIDVYGSLIL